MADHDLSIGQEWPSRECSAAVVRTRLMAGSAGSVETVSLKKTRMPTVPLVQPNRPRRVLRGKQDEKSASIRMRKCRRMRDEGRA
jgi:hypothetical protein